MRQIFATSLIVLSLASCSFWNESDSNLVTIVSYATATPTATVQPPSLLLIQIESAPWLDLYPTATPQTLIDLVSDSELHPWFQVPNWHWLPLTLP